MWWNWWEKKIYKWGVLFIFIFRDKKVILLLFPPTSPAGLSSPPSRENRVHIGMFKKSIQRNIFGIVIESPSFPQLERLVTRNRIFKSPNLSHPGRLRRRSSQFRCLRFTAVAGGGLRRRESKLIVWGHEKVPELRQGLVDRCRERRRRGDRGDLVGETLDDGIEILNNGIRVGVVEKAEEVVFETLDLRCVGLRVGWVESEALVWGKIRHGMVDRKSEGKGWGVNCRGEDAAAKRRGGIYIEDKVKKEGESFGDDSDIWRVVNNAYSLYITDASSSFTF